MTSHAQNDEPTSISRRRIVRTGAMLAWTVPAISVATAIPAFAASGCSLGISGTTANWVDGELNYIEVPLSLSNQCNTPVTGLTVTLYVCGIKDVTYAGADPYLPWGWSQGAKGNKALTPDSNGCYTLVFTDGQALGANSTTNPTFRVKSMAYTGSGNHRPAGTITATVSANGYVSQTFVLQVPKVG